MDSPEWSRLYVDGVFGQCAARVVTVAVLQSGDCTVDEARRRLVVGITDEGPDLAIQAAYELDPAGRALTLVTGDGAALRLERVATRRTWIDSSF